MFRECRAVGSKGESILGQKESRFWVKVLVLGQDAKVKIGFRQIRSVFIINICTSYTVTAATYMVAARVYNISVYIIHPWP